MLLPDLSDACNHDQFPARAEGAGTRMLGLSFFIVCPWWCFSIHNIAAGIQVCRGEKRENETPLRYEYSLFRWFLFL